MVDDTTIVITDTTTYKDKKPTATDAIDGSNIEVKSTHVIEPLYNKEYIEKINYTYTATDLAGNVAQKHKTVLVKDTTSPEIKLNGNKEIHLPLGRSYTDKGAKSTDESYRYTWGETSQYVTGISNPKFDENKPGEYIFT